MKIKVEEKDSDKWISPINMIKGELYIVRYVPHFGSAEVGSIAQRSGNFVFYLSHEGYGEVNGEVTSKYLLEKFDPEIHELKITK